MGRLRLIAEDGALAGIFFDDHRGGAPEPAIDWVEDDGAFAEIAEQLDAYFRGKRTSFDLPIALDGTPFQRRVWEALTRIPYGTTTTYGQLAADIGSPGSARAVGRANAKNPISIVVPCHRVVGADGSLTGYAGGERNKAALLALEAPRSAPS